MKPQIFMGPDLNHVFRAATAAMGEDVAVVNTRMMRRGTQRWAEIVAVRGEEVERFRAELDPGALPVRPPEGDGVRPVRPLVVALVGPTGAGKTTTAAKLALSAHAFGDRRAALLTLDTFRVGAVEQIQTYADVAGLELEVVYRAQEVEAAMARLLAADVVIVDTPGRGPKAAAEEAEWRETLAAIAPDEVHLVLPATLRFDVADHLCDAYAAAGVTHLLLTKLDELPQESAAVPLASRIGMPARWATDGQDVPSDLRHAVPRLLDSLGRTPATAGGRAVA
jgi:flagellar biosynthesis protein FlhF